MAVGMWQDGIVDGESFFEAFCAAPANPTPPTPASSSSALSTLTSTLNTGAKPTLLGYPYYPVVKDPNNQVAGYFLNATGYDDTAILRIGSFANENASQVGFDITSSFVNTTRHFFAATKATKKIKLIIEVAGNGGGNTLLPNFTSWTGGDEPYYPPVENNGDEFSAIGRVPMNSSCYTHIADGLALPGTPNSEPLKPLYFLLENVVVLTDGICASACSIFVELFTR